MAIPILPTSFFGNPDPQGSISGNIARLAIEAGDALTKRIEQNAIQNEASLKAPAIGKIYGDAFQRLATGDITGLAGLAQANAIAGGNPILNQMNSDAFHLGTSVLNDANTRTMLQTRLDAENNMLGRKLSAESGIQQSSIASHERIAAETIQGRDTAISEAGWQKQYADTQKERQKLQDKYQQDHDAWSQLNAAGKDAGPEPQMPMLPELPPKPTASSGPTLPQSGGLDQSPLFDTNGTQVARATAVPTTPGTVKQPDGTIAPEPALPLQPSLPSAQPTPAAPAAAATSPAAAAPVARVPKEIPDKAKEILASHNVNPEGLKVAPQADGSFAVVDTFGHEAHITRAEFDAGFGKDVSEKTSGLKEIKFGNGSFIIPLVDEKKDSSDKTTISAKIGNVTRTATDGSNPSGTETNEDRLRKQSFGENVQEFSNAYPDASTFISKFLPPTGKGIGINEVRDPKAKTKGNPVVDYQLYGINDKGEHIPFSSPEAPFLNKGEADGVKVLMSQIRGDKHRFVPGPQEKTIEPPKFESPVAQKAFDDLKAQAKSEGWSQEKFITESQKIDKSGVGMLDLPKGYERVKPSAPTPEENKPKIDSIKENIKTLLAEVDEFKGMFGKPGLGDKNLAPVINVRLERVHKLRQQIRSLGGDPGQ